MSGYYNTFNNTEFYHYHDGSFHKDLNNNYNLPSYSHRFDSRDTHRFINYTPDTANIIDRQVSTKIFTFEDLGILFEKLKAAFLTDKRTVQSEG